MRVAELAVVDALGRAGGRDPGASRRALSLGVDLDAAARAARLPLRDEPAGNLGRAGARPSSSRAARSSPAGRRLLNLGIGLVVGLARGAARLVDRAGIAPEQGLHARRGRPHAHRVSSRPATEITPLTYAGYFGLLSLLAGSPWLAARDRKTRFRVFPVLKTGAVAAILGLVLPFPQPWGLGIAAVTAIVTQAGQPLERAGGRLRALRRQGGEAGPKDRLTPPD